MKLKKINTDHNHDRYITTQEFNKLALENLIARLAQAIYQAKMIMLIS